LEFQERFGARGQDPRRYFGIEVAHAIPSTTRANIGQLRAADILLAHKLFGVKYRNEGSD